MSPLPEPPRRYLLIEVRERHPDWHTTDVARLRKAVHEFAAEHDLNVADVVLRDDTPTMWWGVRNPYPEVRAIFRSLMESARRASVQRSHGHGRVEETP